MKCRDYLFTVLLLFLIHPGVMAQKDWVLKLQRDGIKVYTKKQDGSCIKAIKAECTIATSVKTLTAVLLDINSSGEWMYATKRVSILKQLSPTEVIYYSEVGLPWPINNRDFIVHFSITQDSVTKVVTATSLNKPDFLPRNEDIVRVEKSYSQWQISPLSNGQLQVEFELQVDPGGNIPAWLTNLFATTGPFYTFQKLREQVKKPEYNNDTGLAFIK